MALFGIGKSKKKVKGSESVQTTVPDFLKPLVSDVANFGSDAFSTLRNLLSGNLVAPRTPQQEIGEIIGTQRALGAGGFIPTAQQTFLDAAQGGGIENLLPPEALSSLFGIAGAGGGANLPPELLATLGTPGGDIQGTAELAALAGQNVLPNDVLQSIASGENFNQGSFDNAFQAALNRALPGITSNFGVQGGVGAGTGGLAQIGKTQAAADAFAGLFNQDQNRRLQAANILQQGELQDRGQTADILSQLANFDLSGRGLDITGATNLANILQSGDQNAISAALAGGNLGLQSTQQALDAAGQLPQLADLERQLLNDIGLDRQAFEQLQIDRPIEAQNMLLTALFSSIPQLAPLFGQDRQFKQKGKSSSFDLSFGS